MVAVREEEIPLQLPVELPATMKKMTGAQQTVFRAWIQDPSKSLKQHCREIGPSYSGIKKAAKEQDWRGLINQVLGAQMAEVTQMRAQEASVALLGTICQLREMWRTVNEMREMLFDDDGNRREIVLTENEEYNAEGTLIRKRRTIANPMSLLSEYLKAQERLVNMQREVTGLAMMDKMRVSAAGSSEIINNVTFGFGEYFEPATGN